MHGTRAVVWLAAIALAPGFGWAQAGKKVSKQEALEAAVTKVQPSYPAMARQFNIEGSVELEALISETGTVDQVNIVSGNPILTKPATEALKKWKFKPFLEEGKAVPALAPINFVFKKPA